MLEDKIDEIDWELDKTEDYEMIINLLYKKTDLLEEIIGKLKNQNKLASEEHEKRFNEFEAKIKKKDKIIYEIAYEVASMRNKGFMSSEIEQIINEFERKIDN